MPAAEYETRFRAALDRLNASDLPAAAALCDALLLSAPDDPAALQLAAAVALRQDQPAKALAQIGRGLELRPGHLPSLMLQAHAARAAGDAAQAVASLRIVVQAAPTLAEAAFLLCRTLLECRDPSLDAALAHTATRFPAAAADWQALGLALQRAGRKRAALAAFTRAAAADPTLAQAQFGCGLLLREAGRPMEARDALRRAVSLDPDASGAWFALGLALQDMADHAGAADAFAAALRSRRDFAEAAVNLGIARQQTGDMPAALAAYRTAIRIRPETLGRIAQALTTSSTGMLCLDVAALHGLLETAGAPGAEPPAIDAGAT